MLKYDILEVENERGTKISLLIPPETTLLVNKNQKVHVNQIIAEIKKDANLVLEEDRKDIYTEVLIMPKDWYTRWVSTILLTPS